MHILCYLCLHVLILVLMEDGLGLVEKEYKKFRTICLNPCFNGRWSRTYVAIGAKKSEFVLILVLMEDGLGLSLICHKQSFY